MGSNCPLQPPSKKTSLAAGRRISSSSTRIPSSPHRRLKNSALGKQISFSIFSQAVLMHGSELNSLAR